MDSPLYELMHLRCERFKALKKALLDGYRVEAVVARALVMRDRVNCQHTIFAGAKGYFYLRESTINSGHKFIVFACTDNGLHGNLLMDKLLSFSFRIIKPF